MVSVAFAQGFRSRSYIPQSYQHVTRDVYETTPGNYFAAGISTHSSSLGWVYKLCVSGMDSQGAITWTKSYGSFSYNFYFSPFSVRSFCKSDSFLYYTGPIADGSNKICGALIKFNFAGDTVWQRTYGDPALNIIPYAVTPSADGGFIITGFAQSDSTEPCFALKTDANGNELWRTILNKSYPNVIDGRSIVEDSQSRKILIVGMQYLPNSVTISGYSSYGHLTILDSLGNFLNRITYKSGQLTTVLQTSDNNFLLAGNEEVNYPPGPGPPYEYAPYAIKFDLNNPNSSIWQLNLVDGLIYDINFNMAATQSVNGDILIAGVISNKMVSSYDRFKIRIIRLSSAGTIIYKKYYDYATKDSVHNIFVPLCINMTSDGGHIVGIRCTNFNVINPLFYVKYDSTGCDSTIIYCLTDGAVSAGEITKNSGISVFPNPANDNIHLNAGDKKNLVASISDLQGRVLVQQETGSGTTSIPMPLAKGLYLLSVRDVNGRLVHLEKVLKE